MTLIKQLSEDLINKIAAGEVIERPASVIKELVENSLDANSTRITITIADGGKKLLKVADDGCGIANDELELAVSRHATSKIFEFDDLYRLNTMGFRGEALASICSVAKVSLASKTEDGEPMEILLEAGVLRDKMAAAQPRGTTVTVKYLFYQTPARLKFLKTNETETGHIVDTVTRISLCHPDVSFKVLDGERVLFDAPACGSLFERVVQVVGRDVSEYLYDFEAGREGMRAYGLFSHPQIARSQRNLTYIFVNGRAVNDKVIHHAVMEAYRDLLMRGKYPVLLLNLVLAADLVDVNVHPTKSEVRFHQSQAVHHFVLATLRERLVQAPWLNQSVDLSPDCRGGVAPPEAVQNSLQNWSQKYYESPLQENTSSYAGRETPPQRREETHNTNPSPSQPRQVQFGKTRFADMTPLSQLWGTYILCETAGKLVLIDQHAAHERIGFEKLIKQYDGDGIASQAMLIPETFDLKPSDADIVKNYLDEFKKFGFEIEFFGGLTFVIKAVPVLLMGKIDVRLWIMDLVEDLKASGELTSLKDKWHHMLATMACHAQVRAHHHLEPSEIEALLKELDYYQFTDFCPHGRPVSIEVGQSEVERWFKRIL